MRLFDLIETLRIKYTNHEPKESPTSATFINVKMAWIDAHTIWVLGEIGLSHLYIDMVHFL
jgi:hypothetical protein